MSRSRPAGVLVMGILNIIFGVLGLFCGLCAAGINLALGGLAKGPGPGGGPNPVEDLMKYMERNVPGYMIVEVGHGLLLVLLGVFFLVAGVGLLAMGNWARWLAVVTGVLVILLELGYLFFEAGVVVPATQQWQAEFARRAGVPASSLKSNQVGTMVGVVAGRVFWIIVGFANVIVLMLPGIGSAFGGAGDRYDGRRRRRRDWDGDEEDEDEDDRGERWRD